MKCDEIAAVLEAILFVAGDAVERRDIAMALEITMQELEQAVCLLESEYDYGRRGFRVMRFGSRLQMATRSEYTRYVERVLVPIKRQTLTQSALETLAVIAYRQPCTRAEIEAVRGVRCEYAVAILISYGLVREVGRRDAVGRPILYGTTEEFLRHFGLSGVDDLPALISREHDSVSDAGEEVTSEVSKEDFSEEAGDPSD